MILEISALIASCALVLLVIFLIPSVIQIRRTAKTLDETSQTLNSSLPVIISRIDGITSNISSTSGMLRYRAENLSNELDRVVDLVHEGVDLGESIQNSVKYPFTESMITLAATLKGISTFFHVLRQQ